MIKKKYVVWLLVLSPLLLGLAYWTSVYYWQARNIQWIKDIGAEERFIGHGINNAYKLNDMWRQGLRSFELDLVFDADGSGRFFVGHEAETVYADFESFMGLIDFSQVKSLWLDVKNLSAANMPRALAELNRLDAIYHLKSRALIESPLTAAEFALASDDGWYTSIYLTTPVSRDATEEQLHAYTNALVQQAILQRARSVSYPAGKRWFVEQYLAPALPETVRLNSWSGPTLRRSDFQEEVKNTAIYWDDRHDLFIFGYRSFRDIVLGKRA